MKFYEKASAVAVTTPILVGAAIGGVSPAAEPKPREPQVRTYYAQGASTSGVTATTINVQTPPVSVIPLTVQTFIPGPIVGNEEDVDYFDIDFGEPDPFVVPAAWVDQFSDVDPFGGSNGTIHEQESD